jgi:hypothetical protein
MPVTTELISASPVTAQAPITLAAALPPELKPAAKLPECEGVYLTGRPTLKRFLRHVRHHALHPPSEGTLVDEWEAARSVLRQREKDEAGIADNPSITKLGPEYEPLLIELLKDPLIRNGFNTVPTEIAMVDLDQMVVYQKHIDLTFTHDLAREIPAAPTDAELFRICLPYDHKHPPVQWSSVESDKFVFVSPSNDLRFLGVMPLETEHITNYAPPGSLVGVVGIAVGFGSNFMNAVYAENRLILRNGSHRAYTLYQRGIRRVPCIVQHVRTRDELELVSSSEIERQPDLYLRNPRPPMLKDYHDPLLHKRMPIQRRVQQVTVSFRVETAEVPAL